MAQFYWTGAISGAWDDGRNWQDADGNPYGQTRWPGSDSAETDDVWFHGELAEGAASPSEWTWAGLRPLGTMRVTDSYNGSIGSAGAGTGIEIAATNVEIDAEAAGEIYLSGETVGSGIERMLITGGTVYLNGLISGSLTVLAGTVNIGENGADLTAASVTIGQINSLGDTTVTISEAAQLPSVVTQFGGRIQNYAAVERIELSGGVLDHYWSTITDLLQTGGTFNYYMGTITRATLIGGTFDATVSDNFRTIGRIEVGGPALVKLNCDLGRISWTEGIRINSAAATVRWGEGQLLVPG